VKKYYVIIDHGLLKKFEVINIFELAKNLK